MEEMDHETSANVDVEGPSTLVNVYGSPLAPHGRRLEESVASTSHVVTSPLANVNRVVSSILHCTRENIGPRNPFLENHRFAIANISSCHRPVPVRIRVAIKRQLKLLAVQQLHVWN